MEAHLTELYGLGKEDWPVAKCTVKDNKCQGDVEKGFESLWSQNGVCRCEACSI